MGKIARLILAFAVAFVAAGCFDYAERMEFNADGSGTLHQHMVLYKGGFTGLMEMMGEMVPDSVQDSSMFTFIKRADIEKKLENTKGVKLIDFKESQNDSTATYDIKYSFTDIEEMMSVTANMGGDEMMEGMVPKKGALFEKEATGNWKFSRDFGDSSMENFLNPPAEPTADQVSPENESDSLSGEDQFSGMAKMMQAMMMQAFANRTVKLTVKFPGRIAESNATKVEGSEATWEYKFVDMGKAPRFLEASIKP